jgi:hypothetical protein
VAGDTENYDVPVYKAKVVENFKGSKEGDTLYIGPYLGSRLGYEYLLFLRNLKTSAVPKAGAKTLWDSVSLLQIFDEGYSSMEISYECVFDGGVPERSCDYGVRVCTDYITLPKGIQAFPPEKNDPPFGCRWVRKKAFIPLLESLVAPPLPQVPLEEFPVHSK